jgi:hypothetical protein
MGRVGFVYTRFKAKPGRPKKWHLWNGTDTECRMFNEFSQVKKEYREFDELQGDKIICKVCLNNKLSRERKKERRRIILLKRTVSDLDKNLAKITAN